MRASAFRGPNHSNSPRLCVINKILSLIELVHIIMLTVCASRSARGWANGCRCVRCAGMAIQLANKNSHKIRRKKKKREK